MKVIEEITKWDTEFDMPNHIYFVNDSKDKMYAYLPQGTQQVTKFKVPIKFSISKRKFREIENTFDFAVDETVPAVPSWQVTGSKGDVYTVTRSMGAWACTCSGFKFRNQCRHIQQVAEQAK